MFPDNMKKMNHWYKYVMAGIEEYQTESKVTTSYPCGPFVGHCCELLFYKRRVELRSGKLKTKFDGCLFLPEYKLLIGPSLSDSGIVDIHGFSGFHPHFAGVVHCVPSPISCAEYERKGVSATGVSSCYRLLDGYPMTIPFLVPYETSERKVNNEEKKTGIT